jgi:hypothetical protein
MAWDAKVLKAARIVLRKHGTDALSVAQRRADEWSERGAEDAANLWRVIGSAMLAILNRARRKTGRRASLSEVLHGSVTRRMMESDGVTRHYVTRLMRQTKRRRANSDPITEESGSSVPPTVDDAGTSTPADVGANPPAGDMSGIGTRRSRRESP